jgi:hypothetical protein
MPLVDKGFVVVGAMCASALVLLAGWLPRTCMITMHEPMTSACSLASMALGTISCGLPAYLVARRIGNHGLLIGVIVSIGGLAIAVGIDHLGGFWLVSGSELVSSFVSGFWTFSVPGILAGGVGQLHSDPHKKL